MKISSMNAKQVSPDAKAAILDYIDDRLREWANWALSGWRLGIGYPPCSLEYRLMIEGHVERSYQGLIPMPEHPDAEKIEALLCEMAAQHPKMAEVIRVNYWDKDGIPHKARRTGLSHTQFKAYLSMGRWWLAGRLSSTSRMKTIMQNIKTY